MVLGIPNKYFIQRLETDYRSQIQEILKLKFCKNIEIQFQIVSTVLTAEENLTEKPKSKMLLMEKNSFSGSPYFKNQTELQSCIEKAKLQKIPDYKTVELLPMPNKYGAEKVACFSTFDSRFFAYPANKRKKARVDVKIK